LSLIFRCKASAVRTDIHRHAQKRFRPDVMRRALAHPGKKKAGGEAGLFM
jgi:hypothetical protein